MCIHGNYFCEVAQTEALRALPADDGDDEEDEEDEDEERRHDDEEEEDEEEEETVWTSSPAGGVSDIATSELQRASPTPPSTPYSHGNHICPVYFECD
jgi:hypothetical protein